MKKLFSAFKIYELIYFIMAIIIFTICFAIGIKKEFTYLKILSYITVVFSLCGTFLNLKKRFYCFYFYLIAALLYAVASLLSKQYGEAILNFAYLTPLYLYSLIRYLRKKDVKDSQTIINKKVYIIIPFFMVVVTLLYGYILLKIDSNSPFLNSLATASIMVASFLTSRKKKEQWIFWIFYDIVVLAIWIIAQNSIFITQNIVYIVFNIYGMFVWFRDKKGELNNEQN